MNPSKRDKKKELCFELAAVVRKIQKQYIAQSVKSNGGGGMGGGGGGEDLSSDVEELCNTIEAVFLHELKNSKARMLWREMKRANPSIPPEPSFWVFVDPLVPDEIKMQLHALRNSDSYVMKCRSWVRLTLAKKLMISFLEDLQRHPGLLASHYGDEAILRDPEQSEVIVQLLRGLSVLQLHFDHTGLHLGSWEPHVLSLAGIWEGPVAKGAGSRSGSGTTSPVSVTTSPANSSPSVQRVSPPASDFDLEGVTIIDIALDKYSQKKSKSSITDSELISKEISSRPSPRLQGGRRGRMESFDSTGSGEGVVLEAERSGSAGVSYEAMLLTHAKKASGSSGSSPRGGRGGEGGAGGGGGGRGRLEKGGDSDAERGVAKGSGMGVGFGSVMEEDDLENSERYSIALDLNYEVISSDGSIVESHSCEPHQQQKLVMVDHLVKLVNEKGLDSQKYKCCGCNRDIGLIFGQAKLCKFNGQHYCYDCHRDDERIIPARVLFNWDFRPHKVCLASCEFLDSVEVNPVLDVEQINKALYLYIPALEEALKLRQQCKYLKDYLVSCKEPDIMDQFRKRLKSLHICDEIHKYSLKDLMEVNSGVFNERLRKLVKMGSNHVKKCMLCSQKGFICELCHDPGVIYPFDLAETCQCGSCKAVYHKVCSPESGNCPRCLRIRQRANSATKSD